MDFYTFIELLEVYRRQKAITPFWLNFFPNQINFETDEVAFDKVSTDDRYLAPFVSPNVQGQVMGLTGFEAVKFKPAYTKPKHAVDPNMVLMRQPGEAPYVGSLTKAQRRDATIAEIVRKHGTLHANRNEWLACKAIVDGKVIIEGENYPKTLVDFRRDPSLTTTLVGGAKWDQNTSSPLNDLVAARKRVNVLSGARVSQHIFGADAWDKFYVREKDTLKEMMNTQYRGSTTEINTMLEGNEGIEYVGRIAGVNGAGAIDVYIDTSKYKDENNVEQFFLDQNTVVGVSSAVEGVRCFGAIKDFDANFVATDVFFKNWREQDPSHEFILSQSAPLMVPREPNATYSLKVA